MSPDPRPGQDVPLIEVDARGLRCPLPVIRLAEAARGAAAGTVIVVLAGDPAARHDIPAWCRMRDHELLEMTETQQGTEVTGASGRPGSDGADETREADEADEGELAGTGPAYLRFVVLIRPQRSKAGGSGNGSERSSRAR